MDYSSFYAEAAGPSTSTTILSLVLGVLSIVAMWRIFQKAGENGWAAIIPFYNMYILFKITWGSGWKFLLMLIPIANVVIAIMTVWKLGDAFGKGTGFKFGLIFLGTIFMLLLGFGDAAYLGVPGKGGYVPPRGYQPTAYEPQQNHQQTGYQPEPTQPAQRFCSSCGSQLDQDATFCTNCGARQ